MIRFLISTLAFLGLALALSAQEPKKEPEKKYPPKYKPNDRMRPRPKVIEPPTASTAEQSLHFWIGVHKREVPS